MFVVEDPSFLIRSDGGVAAFIDAGCCCGQLCEGAVISSNEKSGNPCDWSITSAFQPQ